MYPTWIVRSSFPLSDDVVLFEDDPPDFESLFPHPASDNTRNVAMIDKLRYFLIFPIAFIMFFSSFFNCFCFVFFDVMIILRNYYVVKYTGFIYHY